MSEPRTTEGEPRIRHEAGLPRVALFTGAYDHIRDGVSLTLNRLVAYLEREGVPVRVLAPTTDRPALAHAGTLIPIRSVAAPGRPEYRVSLGLSRPARRELEAFSPDLLHIATPDLLGVAALRLGHRRRLPVVASYHTHFTSYLSYYRLGLLEGALWRYLRWFYARCEQVYVPSPSMIELLREKGVGGDLRLWSRGVETRRFTPALRSPDWRRSVGAGDDDVLITFVSRIVPEKGIDVLAEVLEGLRARGVAHRSVVVGEGPSRASLQRRLPETRFTGTLRGEELARAYASSDVFLFPSDTETFGNVTLEAMASGVPPVVADATGARSLVRHASTGLLAPPRDATAFRRHVERLIGDPVLRREMGAAARQDALAYDWEVVLGTILSYYRNVARSRAGPPFTERRG